MESAPIIVHRLATSWPWFIIRGAGFVSLILLILLMLSGIGHVTGWTYRYLEPVKAWLVHKWLSYLLIAMVLIHMFTLLIDHFVIFRVQDLFVPFLNRYSNHTHIFGISPGFLAVASGIIAFYGIIYIVITSLKLIDTHKKFWKYSHLVSYLVMLLVFLHALNTGSDLISGILRWVTMVVFLGLLLAVTVRLRRRTLSS